MRGGQHQPTAHLLSSRSKSRHLSQSGATLVEVLIAVFLIGTVIAALAAGMLTLMRSTGSTAEQQRLAASVMSYTEWLRSQTYRDCAAPADFGTWTELPRVSARVDDVRYWNVAPGATWTSAFAGACSTDQGRQLLDVTVELDGGPTTTAQVVLRRTA